MPGKRRDLTTDDLLRMQEDGPARKRRKEAFILDEGEDSDSEEAPTHRPHVGGDVDDSEFGSGSNSESREDESEEEREGKGAASDSDSDGPAVVPAMTDDQDDVSSSRISIVPRTSFTIPRKSLAATAKQSTSFASMGISSTLLAALSKMSIRNPTEIQAACIPPLLQGEFSLVPRNLYADIDQMQGRDCIGNAKTGSGKTIAFALPIIQRLSVDPYGIFALVLTPTR